MDIIEGKQGKAKSSSDSTSSKYDERQKTKDETSELSRKSEDEDPYKILKIRSNTTQGELITAYRKLAQMYHPDKVAGLAPEYREIAEKKMKSINEAFEKLKNRMKEG